MERVRKSLLVLAAVLSLAACEKGPEEPESEVLARVNGEPITAADLEAARSRTFSNVERLSADGQLDRKLLESLVATRVMAKKAEQAMSEKDKRELAQQVKAWREEQLVRRYLESQVSPEPVSKAMVEEYYHKHPELFGGGTRRQYEILRILTADDTGLRDRAVDLLAEARQAADWQAFASQRSTPEMPVDYRRGRAGANFEDKTLLARLQPLKPGEASPLSMANGEVSLVRVVAMEEVPPKPLIEVRADIRRRLAPVKLRAAVKEVMDAALRDADVEYAGDQANEEQ